MKCIHYNKGMYMCLHGWCFFFKNPIFCSFAQLECISFIYPDRSPNSVFAQCHEMRKRFSELALNGVEWWTKNILFVYLHVCRIFFSGSVVLTEHCFGWVICNISLDRLRTVYSLFIFQVIFRFYLSSKRSALLSFLKTIYIYVYLGR
jgi:hypothetical protein